MNMQKGLEKYAGKSMVDPAGKPVGKLEKVLNQDGVLYAVLDLSEYFMAETRLFTVPWDKLEVSESPRDEQTIQVSKRTLADVRRIHQPEAEEVSPVDDLILHSRLN